MAILTAAAICHPLDTLKRRVQLNSTSGYSSIVVSGDKLPSALKMARYLVKNEGIFSFYNGFTLCLMKAGPLALLHFAVISHFRGPQN